MISIKIHEAYRSIVAVCDSNLIGKTFEEGNKCIDIRANFFEGEQKTKKEAIEILKKMNREDATFNIVGEEAVKCGLEAGMIKKEGIMKIGKVPVALGLI